MDCTSYIQIILCLKSYLRQIFGFHYPTELINYIVLISYVPIRISCGTDFVSVISNNKIFVWGANTFYELGLGDKKHRNIPQYISLNNITKIKSSDLHTIAFSNSGTLYVWGNVNTCDSLGITQSSTFAIPHKLDVSNIKIKTNFQSDKIINIKGNNVYLQNGNMFSKNVTSYYVDDLQKIKCGSDHIIFLRKDGTLCSAGSNSCGQLGIKTKTGNKLEEISLTNVITIECGLHHTIALVSNHFHCRKRTILPPNSGQTFNDEIYVWGENCHGQLGLGDTVNRFVPHKLILTTESNPNIRSISCGKNHTMILTELGIIYVWGYGANGQLGLGDIRNRYLPQKLCLDGIMKICCGASFSMAITYSNKIYAWGYNFKGQLGLGDNETRYVPTEIPFKF